MFANHHHKRFNPFGVELGKIKESERDLQFWQRFASEKPVSRQKSPQAGLRHNHRKVTELAMASALAIVLVFSLAFRGISLSETPLIDQQPIVLEVEQIPMTEQVRRQPPPPRPQVLVPTDDIDVPEEETLAGLDAFDFSQIPPPPEPPKVDESSDIFVVYDTAPEPVGGWSELYKQLQYPAVAVRAGVEGRVLVSALINTKGIVEETKILKESGSGVGFEKAAEQAIQSLRFKPAMQRDRPVKVWVTVPVSFSLITRDS